MKCFLPFLLLLCLKGFSQTNSVELKSGGTSIGMYNSVTAAYAAIPTTISQPYLIELQSIYTAANETYPITFTAKTGESSINTITLRPALGVSTALTMTTSVTSGTSAVIVLNNADYVIIDGRPGGIGNTSMLAINNTATASNTVQLINGSSKDTIRYVSLQNAGTSSASRTLYINTSASNTTGNSDNYFSNIVSIGSRYGFNTNGTAANPNTRNTIYGCEFQNVIFTGIWYQAGTAKLTVDSSKFTSTSASTTTPYGILCDNQTDTLIFTRNIVTGLSVSNTSAIRGVYIRTTLGASYSYITNNFISLAATNSSSTSIIGIHYEGSVNTKAEIYHNTVLIGGTLSSGGTSGDVVSGGFVKSHTGAADEFNIGSNIFVNTRTGGTSGTQHLALSLSSSTGTFAMNANTYNSTSGILLRNGTTTYTDVASWQSALNPNEQASNNTVATFVSDIDLHLAGTSHGNMGLSATPISSITKDIDNQLRNTILTYRGADEVLAFPLPISLLSLSATKTGNKVLVKWATASEQNNKGFNVLRSTDGVNFVSLGFVIGLGNSNKENTYSYTDVFLPNTDKIYYRLEQQDADGRKQLSSIVWVKQEKAGATMVVFPNPFISSLNANIHSEVNGTATVIFSNSIGEVLQKQSIKLNIGNNVMQFSKHLETLPSGMYFVSVESTAFKQTITVFKN